VNVPEGFEVTLFADDDLAHDIFSMTVDSLGRVVVSGPGYVRILIDDNKDGRAESYRQFADSPQSGAQGMYFHGRDLLCTGDAGLIRYRDRNGDDKADGPPETFIKIKTGSEHHAHAIRRGPDGWWYLLAGNMAGVTGTYATLPTSPVRQPESGVLMRLTPSLSAGEIVADGYRNSYDFAFNTLGDVFLFDSDGERDVSLPWYRPTRVFQVLPGSHAGWHSRSWKRPDGFFDMPPVVASFGRGSPTGVACYRHNRFPVNYRGALFVADWTFGRVMALPMQRDGEVWASKPIEFMTGKGQFGFAPTDIAVGADGALYVSVGGRGTRGGVFRVTARNAKAAKVSAAPTTLPEKLTACLNAPLPLSSWSRAKWMPLASLLGRKPFLKSALNDALTPAARVRSIEILTELFDGLDTQALLQLSKAKSAEVRARAIWSHGRTQRDQPIPALMRPFLTDNDPFVVRSALEVLACGSDKTAFGILLTPISGALGSPHRFVRDAASRIVSRMPPASVLTLSRILNDKQPRGQVSFAFGVVRRKGRFNAPAVTIGADVVEGDNPAELKHDSIRLMQIALGDVGPGSKAAPAFDGYTPRSDLSKHERLLDPIRIRMTKAYPTGNATVDYELARLLAMLSPLNPDFLDRVLERIDEKSNPLHDIHHLIVAARIPIERSTRQTDAISRALVQLEPKIRASGLNLDTNWTPRVSEILKVLVKLDPSLAPTIVNRDGFGEPGHVLFLGELPPQYLASAIKAFVTKIEKEPDYAWNNDVVFVLGESADKAHRKLVRSQFDNFAVRSAVLMVLAEKPETADRDKFIEGLDSSQLEVLTACVGALEKLKPVEEPKELLSLLQTLRRLGSDKSEFSLRERVVKLLRVATKQSFGYLLGKAGYKPQPDSVSQWTNWLTKKYALQSAALLGTRSADLASLKKELEAVDWMAGDAVRGKALFTKRACAQCHGGARSLGPDLAGAARRFSRHDLFTAISMPSRDVSPRYQTTLIQTSQGKTYTGLVIYQAVDGLILRNAQNQTFRIEADDIEVRRTMNESLMPNGLLRDAKPADLADLYAYIRQLGNRTASNR
jgi:putative membrane-bound dehydrogenase-like protein